MKLSLRFLFSSLATLLVCAACSTTPPVANTSAPTEKRAVAETETPKEERGESTTDEAKAKPASKLTPQKKTDVRSCSNAKATVFFKEGFVLQQSLKSQSAQAKYDQCLKLEPNCIACLYEVGWAHWKQEHWEEVSKAWQKALELGISGYPKSQIESFISTAKENFELVQQGKSVGPDVQHPKIGSSSISDDGKLELTLIGKVQGYDAQDTGDGIQYDVDVSSPKSVNVHPSGGKAYVNALEAEKTLVIDAKKLKKTASIYHKFTDAEAHLFPKKIAAPRKFNSISPNKKNIFQGKPVEAAFSADGKFLWVPYYRRSYDLRGMEPSAVALVTTEDEKIISVFPTGSISKYVMGSPDGKWVAVSNWGDNSVTFIDTSSNDPKKFSLAATLFVDKPLDLDKVHGNRDSACGLCLRGETFSKDSKYLFVGRMKDGGIAIFSLKGKKPEYIGSVMEVAPGIRDILLSADGKTIYLSSNSTGFVTRLKTDDLVQVLEKSKRMKVTPSEKTLPREKTFAGLGARTAKLTPDGRYLFVATKKRSEVVTIDLEKFQTVLRTATDSFPVGLDISPKGDQLWVTAQTEHGRGGDSVTIYSIENAQPN